MIDVYMIKASIPKYSISSICFSLARIIATIGIFVYHYLVLIGIYPYRLDFFAILTFCFLSGYFINITKYSRYEWIIKRYLGIMIPYWLVIIPVIIANQIFQYKTHLSFVDYTLTILGGNMLLSDPLYVIGWYITFVVLLYSYAFMESLFKSWKKFLIIVLGVFIFFIWLDKGFYFLSFFIGLRLSEWCAVSWSKEGDSFRRKITRILFVAQRYCYSFFLIHGAVLLFFFRKTDVSAINMFVISFIITILLSIVFYGTSEKLNIVIANKALKC